MPNTKYKSIYKNNNVLWTQEMAQIVNGMYLSTVSAYPLDSVLLLVNLITDTNPTDLFYMITILYY